jgi:transcriptional regulator with XRE-family HTH domain
MKEVSTNTETLIKDKLLRMELSNIRRQRHLTQQQVSEMTGLSTSCISNIESGETTSPTVRSLIKYATAIGVELYINLSPKDKEANI